MLSDEGYAVIVPAGDDGQESELVFGKKDYERKFFSDEDLSLSPEEYAARHGHEWGCFSFHLYRYRDPALGAWVRRVGEILDSAAELEQCRARHLTAQELADIRQQESEGF